MTEFTDTAEIRQVLERAVARLCPAWLQASRDDLVQTAALKIYERQQSGEGKPGLKASYLYKTAHSVLIDEIRRVQRRDESSLEQSPSESVSEAPDPYQTTVGWTLSKAMRECMARLVEARNLAVTLHLQGHRVPEIARLLDWKTKQADNCVYRGLADLRNCLAEKGFEPA